MKFSEFQYTRPDLSAVRARCEEICAKIEAACCAQAQISAYDEFEALRREVETDLTIAYVRHSIDTRDEFYDQENEFSDEAGPQLEEMFQKINLALLGSKFRPEISVRTFKPEILELMQEENRLASQYQKLYASGMVEFRGETMPLTKLGPYLQSPDRETRREAWTVRGSFFDANRAELDEPPRPQLLHAEGGRVLPRPDRAGHGAHRGRAQKGAAGAPRRRPPLLL